MTDLLDNYTQDALRTESKIDKVQFNHDFLISALTLAVCAGEIVDQIKKNVFYGKTVDNDKVVRNIRYIVAGLENVGNNVNNLDKKEDINIDPRVFHAILGIATESTELLQAMKFNGTLDTVNILEESFDIDYYQLILLDQLNADFFQVWDTGFAKLKARYPDKFTKDHAINRNLNKERDILNNITN